MLYDYRVVMEFTPTGNVFPSLTTGYHFTSVWCSCTLLLSVEVMQINKQTKKNNKKTILCFLTGKNWNLSPNIRKGWGPLHKRLSLLYSLSSLVFNRCINVNVCLFVCLFASPQHTTTMYVHHMYKGEVRPGCQRREHVPCWSELHDNLIIIQHVKSTNAIAN